MRKLTNILLILCFVFVLQPVYGDTPKNQLFFDKEAKDGVIDMLMNTNESLYIQMYNFTYNQEIVDCLLGIASKQIPIMIILDNSGSNNPNKEDGTGFPEAQLEQAKIQVRWDNKTNIMHRKVAVSDRTNIFIGSTNWSSGGFEKNTEIDMYISDPENAEKIIARFMLDWNECDETYQTKHDKEKPEPPKEEPPEPPKEEPPPEPPKEPTKPLFIGNSSTMKLHLPDCSYVEKIKPENRVEFTDRQEAIDKGYEPCKVCKP